MLKSIFLSKRAKALYWSSGMMFIAGLLAIATDVLEVVPVQSLGTVAAGLFLAQCSKALNNYLSSK